MWHSGNNQSVTDISPVTRHTQESRFFGLWRRSSYEKKVTRYGGGQATTLGVR